MEPILHSDVFKNYPFLPVPVMLVASSLNCDVDLTIYEVTYKNDACQHKVAQMYELRSQSDNICGDCMFRK